MADDQGPQEPPLNPEDFGLTPEDLAEMEGNALQGFQDDIEEQESRRLRGDARWDDRGRHLNPDQFDPGFGTPSKDEYGNHTYQRFDDDGPDKDGGFKRPRF